MYVESNHRTWDLYLHEFKDAINTAVLSSLKVSSAFLNYDRNPKPVASLRRKIEEKTLVELIDPGVWKDRMTRLGIFRDMII